MRLSNTKKKLHRLIALLSTIGGEGITQNEMEKRDVWYRADFDYIPENYGGGTTDYLCQYLDESTTIEELDDKAIEWAKQRASEGEDFSNIGHVRMELVQVMEVDGEKECFPDVRAVWW